MHIHILGICGTFMGGVAALARAAGHEVTGSDANIYPPMSTQLKNLGVDIMEGYEPQHLDRVPDYVVVGNAMSRGNPAVEAMLDRRIPLLFGSAMAGRACIAQAARDGRLGYARQDDNSKHAGMDPGGRRTDARISHRWHTREFRGYRPCRRI